MDLDPLLADVATAALTNEDCLAVLHGGFAKKVKPKFYPREDKVVEKIDSDILAGLDVFVLAPLAPAGPSTRLIRQPIKFS